MDFGSSKGEAKKFAAAAAKGRRHHHWLQRLATGREEKQRCGNEEELLFDKLPVREPTPKWKYSPVPEQQFIIEGEISWTGDIM